MDKHNNSPSTTREVAMELLTIGRESADKMDVGSVAWWELVETCASTIEAFIVEEGYKKVKSK